MKIINTSLYPDSITSDELDNYLAQGWYRMNQNIFSVTHWLNGNTFEVDRVWWLRFNIDNIVSHRSHQKLKNKNAKFEVRFEKFDEISNDDQVLYAKYARSVSFDAYESLDDCLYGRDKHKNIFNSWSINIYYQGSLIAKGIIDLGKAAVMAKVNFYDPAYSKFSLGKFLILKSLDFMREKGFTWYYPGYVIVNRPKFDYKLFLGKESAEYYDPETEAWKPFCDSIMIPEVLSPEEEHLLYDVYFRYFR